MIKISITSNEAIGTNNIKEEPLKDYLGDGVYVIEVPGIGIELRANDHINPTDTIFLEPSVIRALINFEKRCNEPH